MNYSDIIKDSFRIFWRHKALWLFGVLLVLVGQGEYGFSVNYQERYSYPADKDAVPNFPAPFDNSLIKNFFENPLPYIIGFTILALIWWGISNFIGWLAQGALIGMVDEIEATGVTSINRGWQTGGKNAGRLFLLAIVFALPQWLILLPVLAGGVWFFAQFFDLFGAAFTGNLPPPAQMEERFSTIFPTLLSGVACFFPMICLGGLIGWFLGILNKLTARSCVLENLGVVDSLKRGWHIARKNIGYTLLTWFILAVASGIFGAMAAIPALVLWVPTARALMHGEWSPFSAATAMLMGVYMAMMVIGLGGILTSFNSTLWTKLYQGFAAKENGLEVGADGER